jgi:hypothetical protein
MAQAASTSAIHHLAHFSDLTTMVLYLSLGDFEQRLQGEVRICKNDSKHVFIGILVVIQGVPPLRRSPFPSVPEHPVDLLIVLEMTR